MQPSIRATKYSSGVVVLGMHRSGLSRISGLLQDCGVWFGPGRERLPPQDSPEFPQDDWQGERSELRKFCEAFLRSGHACWWHLNRFDPNSIPEVVRQDLDARFKDILEALSGHGTWGIEGPTLSLLFPALKQHVPDTVCVIPVRNPVEIAKSLQACHGLSISHGIALWEVYMRQALAASQDHGPILIKYSDLIAEPEATTTRLLENLQVAGVTGLRQPDSIDEALLSNRQRFKATDAEIKALLNKAQLELWALLSGDETQAGEVAHSVSEGAFIHFQDLERQFSTQLKTAKDLERAEARAEGLEAQLNGMRVKADQQRRRLEQLQRDLNVARKNPVNLLWRKIVASGRYALVQKEWLFSERRWADLLHFAQKQDPKPNLNAKPKATRTAIHDAVAASRASPRAAPISRKEAGGILADELPAFETGYELKRLFPTFDTERSQRYAAAASAFYDDKCAALKATVVMPTFNRGSKIATAIESVLDQSHHNLELLVVDDGSVDDTRARLAEFSHDPRLKVFFEEHLGVSEARNTGLKYASGDYIFYLDSDNKWTADNLKLMLAGFYATDADCAYSACCMVDKAGNLIGYRGEPYNWEACLSANYVDMNVFGHKRILFDQYGGFDPNLRRMVDWDLILRYTKSRAVKFFPFIGCIYHNDSDDKNRVSRSQPLLFRRIVTEKHQRGLTSGSEALKKLKLSFAIKIAAPYRVRAEWGDFHFADSLSNALERLGHSARIDFHGEWDKPEARHDDVVVVLRGLTGYTPKPDQLTLMWNISHPDQVAYEEYEKYQRVFVASRSYAALLSMVLEKPVYPLLQCTDTDRFHLPLKAPPIDSEARGVFIGNSRNEFRPMVRWSVENDVGVDIFGTRWDQFIPKVLIAGENIPNMALEEKYRSARFVLNDHWHSMKDFGFVSNRVFDVIGCGGKLVSDRVPALEALFGDVVDTVDDEVAFLKAISNPVLTQDLRRAAANYVQQHHSFTARAKALCDAVRGEMSAEQVEADPEPSFASSNPRRRVGLILQRGRAWWTSSAYIRLIGPLTTDHAYEVAGLDLVALDGVDDPRLEGCDICIVQRIGVPKVKDAQRLIRTLLQRDIPLFVDTDDAFFLHDAYRSYDESLRLLMKAAREVWFSTPKLAELYEGEALGRSRVRVNNLDPRFWRDYRNPVRAAFSEDGPIRFVYMGTATHHEDLALVMPAFERLAQDYPGRFDLTLVGITSTPPQAEWLKIRKPPQNAGGYPAFVRFVTRSLEFDVGIAPLVESKFNAAKSDVKFLDYSAMGLLSVVSNGPSYRNCIEEGLAAGCSTNTDSWYNTLSKIIEDRFAFAEMRERATRYVWEERNTLRDPAPLADLLTRDAIA